MEGKISTKASLATKRSKSLRAKAKLDQCRGLVTLAHLELAKALYDEWDKGVSGAGASISQMARDLGTGTNRIREMLDKAKSSLEASK